jgi:hypothetical protein
MPTFNEYTNVDIDISVDDFLDECDSYDIEHVIDYLVNNGYINDSAKLAENTNHVSHNRDEVVECLDVIKENYYMLSTESEELIKQLAKTI